jgi:ABC-type transporter Mla maintaining outer membrane lipid asymmetry ATPase subunit MlaF
VDRRRVGLVFGAGGRLFNTLTVEENVALPLRYHCPSQPAKIQERVDALLAAMELERWRHHNPSGVNLSWQQRAALARALALEPELLFFDNPLAGLDPSHTRWWVQFLDQLAAGHAALHGRPVTVVVAGNDVRPWLEGQRCFGLLEGKRFLGLGRVANAAEAKTDPRLRPFLAWEP